jgi:hypothetical protein
MLCSFPVRAQPPIVDGRNLMFDASRISAASESVIQSVADGMDRVRPQSPSPDDEPAEEPAPPEAPLLDASFEAPSALEPSPAALSPPPEDPVAGLLLADAADRRSFFAHPLPLNTIVGGAKALRMEPSEPHSGQKFGPGS